MKDFLNDKEMMSDYAEMSKEDFLEKYPHISEQDYYWTEECLISFVTDYMRTYSTTVKHFGSAQDKFTFHKKLFGLFSEYEGLEKDFMEHYKKRFNEEFHWHNEWGHIGTPQPRSCTPNLNMRRGTNHEKSN